MSSQTVHAVVLAHLQAPCFAVLHCTLKLWQQTNKQATIHVPVMSHTVRQCCKTTIVLRFAVTDMFYEAPYSMQAVDEACVMQFGVHSQYNWAAYK